MSRTASEVRKTKKKGAQTKKVAMGRTNVIFILDESGSMGPKATDLRGGFNHYIEQLKGDGNVYSVTVIKFGTRVRPLFANQSLGRVPLLTTKNYTPSDGTALYDAIGYGFGEAERQWSTPENPYGEDPVRFVIATDGLENASKEYTKDLIVAGIKVRDDAGNWSFIYLGSDQDAWSIASQLGVAQGNTMSYAGKDTRAVFSTLATATSVASTAGLTQTRSFFNRPITDTKANEPRSTDQTS